MPDGMNVDYDGLIPNNVDLNADARVRKALETWHPGYIDWWKDMGPEGFQEALVYLRTAVSVDPKGWAKFDYVRMPDYKWGILLAPKVEGRTIGFGQHKGEPAWQEVPGEYRGMLRRLITIQGDTEPASVEQQRFLGKTAPSLYDMRNLFQVNVEEGRHLWAMVYLLQKHFGRDGREEAEELLRRRSGNEDSPRMLGAFNEETPDWVSFFMFTFFTDRDGKMQLEALAQSGFDPLSRTCRFMLTEEAHHMFVGETGVQRIIERTCAAMKEAGIQDPSEVERVRALGVVDLPTLQKKMNLHFSLTLDLFGNEVSTNAANAYNAGLKGRYREDKLDGRPPPAGQHLPGAPLRGRRRDRRGAGAGALRAEHAAARRLRGGLPGRREPLEQGDREGGHPLPPRPAARRLQPEDRRVLAHRGRPGGPRRARRAMGREPRPLAALDGGQPLHRLAHAAGRRRRAPSRSWIAPPKVGIDNKPGDFEYVKLWD